jgi:hypothetical protein
MGTKRFKNPHPRPSPVLNGRGCFFLVGLGSIHRSLLTELRNGDAVERVPTGGRVRIRLAGGELEDPPSSDFGEASGDALPLHVVESRGGADTNTDINVEC